MASAAAAAPLYIQIAEGIVEQIGKGTLRAGEKAPSIRRLSKQKRVSISTALQAYMWLESRGHLEARPKSGFFVRRPYASLIPEPRYETRLANPHLIGTNDILETFMATAYDPECIPFAAGCVTPDLYPNRALNLILRRIVNRQPLHSARYLFPPGLESLRRQIARRSPDLGCDYAPQDIVVTAGALEAVNLSLRAVTKPGDVIAVESPTYFGVLGSAASLGLKVVEIATHPQEGICLDRLENAIRKHRVKACIVMSNCHNPLGYVVPDVRKKALADLAARWNLAIIEDDVYGDLAHESPRPRTVKSFDQKGLVLLCSSFSKTLAPGFRVGWVAPGRFRAEVGRLKFLSTVVPSTLPQMAIAEFLGSGGYDRHVNRLKSAFASQVDSVRQAVARYFPEGTRVSRPAGGILLWVEMPPKVDALKLYQVALAERIAILPGKIFSPSNRFRHHIRINCGHAWTEAHERALLKLGRLCETAR
ncbi:MAG TPA: PLP-dependent aminotransferase family protein [Bryobacteraceae bacterium]|nr:PLP-dependent aminotransferase family protein [Bryobacteraceae bacterium]